MLNNKGHRPAAGCLYNGNVEPVVHENDIMQEDLQSTAIILKGREMTNEIDETIVHYI